jgi:chorismate synthase
MLRFLTAGESHGKCLTGILEGMPRGLAIDLDAINLQLRRRQLGYGRGGRMKIERDEIEITSGVRHGRTLGSPIAFNIRNKDWDQWQDTMSIEAMREGTNLQIVTRPRPGHADLAGALKYQTKDIRDILERASARETAVRVAVGAFCRPLLDCFGTRIGSHVISIGKERVAPGYESLEKQKVFDMDPESTLRCSDPKAERRMIALIDKAQKEGDTLGGCVEVIAGPVPPGLGTHIQWDRKLDGRIAQAMMSIPSAKGVEIGSGIAGAANPGSMVHDEIFYHAETKKFLRKTNRAGGVEGGISNGEDVRVRVYLKPIPTLRKPLASVDVLSKRAFKATVERSDVCVVPAAGIIAEAMLALVLSSALLEKFGGDSIPELEGNYSRYLRMLEDY